MCWSGSVYWSPAGGEDKRVAWYDTELSTKPYRALRYHQGAVRAVAYHRSYPLFASASDDGSVHVFHGMVYQVRPACCRVRL
jgi:ribosome biogenesis protein ERB1